MAQVRYPRIALRLWLCYFCFCEVYARTGNSSERVTTYFPNSSSISNSKKSSTPLYTTTHIKHLPKPSTTHDIVDEKSNGGSEVSASAKTSGGISDNSSGSSGSSSSNTGIHISSNTSGATESKGGGEGGGSVKEASSSKRNTSSDGWRGGGGALGLNGVLGGVGEHHPLRASAPSAASATSLVGNLLLLLISVIIAGALFVMLLCFIHKWKENMGTA
ncbi:hypothetical protein SK128_021176, partial [Halocaridina rubra]